MGIEVISLEGAAFEAAIPDLARLRIEVFREWPYLYDGDLEYEERYLERFKTAERAFLAVAKDGSEIVGATTAAPLVGEVEEFRKPFQVAGYNLDSMFYFAESLLLPKYRGLGIGNRFFDLRETHARSFDQYTHAVFCSVVRDPEHPARPADYQPLDSFWNKRGYHRLEGMITQFGWKDIGNMTETSKPMQFWIGLL